MNTLRPVHWFLIVHMLVSVVTSVVVIQTEMMWPMAIQGLFMLLGASFLVFREKGWASIKALHKLTISANHPVKYWLAALSLAGVGVLSMAVYGAIAKPDGLAFVPAISPMVFGLLFGVWLEEMNWRGYALPRLVELHGTIKASLILSVFWSLWHLPYFFAPDYASSPFGKVSDWLPHLPFYFAATFLLTWLGVKTRYSVLLATVAHAAANLVSDWFEPNWLYFAEMIGGGLVLLPVFWWLLARERAGSPLTSE